MTATPVEFHVYPAESRRYRSEVAFVLAVIRQRIITTAADDVTFFDGHAWWRTTSVGMYAAHFSADASARRDIRRTINVGLRRAIDSGLIEARLVPDERGDQATGYRVTQPPPSDFQASL